MEIQMGKPLKDETDNVFGLWTVLRRAPNKGTTAAWHVRCACGTLACVTGASMRSGSSTGCGRCDRRGTHGRTGTRAYEAWLGMKSRTKNQKNGSYKNYGGRGILASPEWGSSFSSFYSDMGDPPDGTSLERIDNDLGYSKSNCKWATKAEQSRNRRNNLIVSGYGKSQCLMDWAIEFGLSPQTVYTRFKAGITNPTLLFSKEKLLWTRRNKGESRQDYQIRMEPYATA